MNPIRVVLADDHAVVRAIIRDFLEATPDIKVIAEASNGLEALRLAEELHPDVLLLDMEMPRMTGIEVARQLQADKSSVPILALSAYDDWPYIQGLLDAGAAGYLTKTEAPGLIVEAVRDVAQGEQGWISRQVVTQMLAWLPYTQRQPVQIPLTRHEKAVLKLITAGKTNQEISQALELDEKMVERHLDAILVKLGVASREAAAKRASQKRII